MNRRSLLRAAVALPVAGRAVAQEAAQALAGIGVQGSSTLGHMRATSSGMHTVSASGNVHPTPQNVAKLFLDPAFRAEAEAVAYQNHRHISQLDVDLASKRSFSLAAKVTFQRQRNVQQELERHLSDQESVWSLIYKKLNPFG